MSGEVGAVGVAACNMCIEGYFKHPHSLACEACPEGGICPWNTTLESIKVKPSHWRLSGYSRTIRRCSDHGGSETCLGGRDAGFEGSGYCREGHTGPLCRICTEPKMYYSEGSCINCPAVEGRVMLVVGPALGAILLLPPTTNCSHTQCSTAVPVDRVLVQPFENVASRCRDDAKAQDCHWLFSDDHVHPR
eukprot:5910039-Prymnesium_polylepis.1